MPLTQIQWAYVEELLKDKELEIIRLKRLLREKTNAKRITAKQVSGKIRKNTKKSKRNGSKFLRPGNSSLSRRGSKNA